MKEWIIIGGGIQGMTVTAHLIQSGTATPDDITIVDPHSRPLANWQECTGRIGMQWLRSPAVHHISHNSSDLHAYAKHHDYAKTSAFLGQYNRPSLELFNDHCENVIAECNWETMWHKGLVAGISKRDHWSVELAGGERLHSNRVVLAFGISEQRHYPDWAKELDGNWFHIMEPGISLPDRLDGEIVILGGGITAAHTALTASQLHPGKVTLLKRHDFLVHDFDSDPGWMGMKYQRGFRALNCYKERRQAIIQARHKGSITRELFTGLRRAEKEGLLSIVNESVETVRMDGTQMKIETNENVRTADTLILSTGFEPHLPNQKWLSSVIEDQQLTCAACGYPIVSSSMEWTEGLYVAGALAELEIGPIARNIAGARQAADRIVSSVQRERKRAQDLQIV